MTDVHKTRDGRTCVIDGRTCVIDGRTCVIKDSINEILSIARHCQTKQVLVNIT